MDPILGLPYNVGPAPCNHAEIGIRHSQIAQDAILRSNLRRVTTRFFGKSVKTRKMAHRSPILPVLWIFTAGLIPAGGCGQSTDVADGTPAAASSEKTPPAAAYGPAQPTSPPGTAKTTQISQGPNLNPVGRSQAQAILLSAVRTLEGRNGVSAKIRHRIDLFDKQLVGSGVYFQQRAGSDHLIRLELRIHVGNQQSSLLQVLAPPNPDGHYLWTYRKLPDEEKLSRIDLVRAARALKKAETMPGRGTEGMLAGFGGLPKLLRGLQAAFDFDAAQPARLDRLPVWTLQGHWKPDRLAKILPDQKAAIEAGQPADLSKLPDHLPDHVVLMLGQEDLFPYRIEYRRGIARKEGREKDSRALVTMELFDVKLDVPIDRTRFIYNPGNTSFVDETDSFLSSLGTAPDS